MPNFNTQKYRKETITKINKFKNTCGISTRKGAKVHSTFRIKKEIDIFKSNVRDKLSQEDGFLNDYYDETEINLKKKFQTIGLL